jgi:hypothetical protein
MPIGTLSSDGELRIDLESAAAIVVRLFCIDFVQVTVLMLIRLFGLL